IEQAANLLPPGRLPKSPDADGRTRRRSPPFRGDLPGRTWSAALEQREGFLVTVVTAKAFR
ncbi:MAG: hypothetical protein WBE57_17850, partial [Xanthobacteraceae bacterium]